jgi:error-prone DNA polymerase
MGFLLENQSHELRRTTGHEQFHSFISAEVHIPKSLLIGLRRTARAIWGTRLLRAVTDRNTMAGIVRAHAAAKGKDIRFIPACRLDLLDGPSLLAYPRDKDAYSLLTALLTLGNMRTEKGKCDLYREDVYAHAKGMKFVVVPPDSLTGDFQLDPAFVKALESYREALGRELYLAASFSYNSQDHKRLYRLAQLGDRLDIPLVATNDVHYHTS